MIYQNKFTIQTSPMKQKQTPKKQVKKVVKKQQLPLPKTDNQDTLFALIKNKSLTSIDLRNITKSSYPPARINDIEDWGIVINTTMELYVNRRNKNSHIARYTLAMKLTDAKKIYKKQCKNN